MLNEIANPKLHLGYGCNLCFYKYRNGKIEMDLFRVVGWWAEQKKFLYNILCTKSTFFATRKGFSTRNILFF